jgi:hypothetical protein
MSCSEAPRVYLGRASDPESDTWRCLAVLGGAYGCRRATLGSEDPSARVHGAAHLLAAGGGSALRRSKCSATGPRHLALASVAMAGAAQRCPAAAAEPEAAWQLLPHSLGSACRATRKAPQASRQELSQGGITTCSGILLVLFGMQIGTLHPTRPWTTGLPTPHSARYMHIQGTYITQQSQGMRGQNNPYFPDQRACLCSLGRAPFSPALAASGCD